MKIIDQKNLKQDWDNTKLFGGEYGGFQRFDVYRYPFIKQLTALQQGAFWVPEEIALTDDARRFSELSKNHREAFRKNLLFQTLADSLQSRGVDQVLTEMCTDPSAEALLGYWSFYERIHGLSYSHIVRSVMTNATEFFDSINDYPEISSRFDKEVHLYNQEDPYIPELLIRVLLLEGVKFYVSFLVTYMINKQNDNALQGIVRVLNLIQNDEDIHLSISANMLRVGMKDATELGAKQSDVSEWEKTAHDFARQTFDDEMGWFKYLQPLIDDIPMMSEKGVEGFLKYRVDKTLALAGFAKLYNIEKNELTTWFETNSDINNKQVAAQESEILSYQVGQLKNDL